MPQNMDDLFPHRHILIYLGFYRSISNTFKGIYLLASLLRENFDQILLLLFL